MDLAERVATIRRSVALSWLNHVRYVRLRGEGAHALLHRVFPRELYLRDGQLSQSLLLDVEGRIFADCYLGSDAHEFFLLAEGPDPGDLLGYLETHAEGIDDLELLDMGPEYGLIGLDGPYAWELMAGLVGPEVIGLPYLTFFHHSGLLCCRAGKTGEYGYVVVVRRPEMERLFTELVALGRSLDVAEAGLEALDRCALENWFFNIRGEGRVAPSPLELQLQWRISRRKTYVGSEALRRHRESGIPRRLTCLVGAGPMTTGDPVRYDGVRIGTVVNAGHSPIRGDWVSLALLDLEYALPGVSDLVVGDAAAASTVSPPVIVNRSLYVNPQVHSYASRHEDDFPALVPS